MTETSENHVHLFETELVDEAATASGDRLPYDDLMIEREKLLAQPYIKTSEEAPNPILFFNQHRQLLHANKAALSDIIRMDIDEATGLRLGELFGCDHKMSSKPGELYKCHDCNSMPSLRSALKGRQSREERHLIMHPGNNPIKAAFRISAIPIAAGDLHLAMMIFEKVDESDSV